MIALQSIAMFFIIPALIGFLIAKKKETDMNIIIKINTDILNTDDAETEVAWILADLSDRVRIVGLDIGDKWPLRHDNAICGHVTVKATDPVWDASGDD